MPAAAHQQPLGARCQQLDVHGYKEQYPDSYGAQNGCDQGLASNELPAVSTLIAGHASCESRSTAARHSARSVLARRRTGFWWSPESISATMAPMRSLVALLAGIGTLAGVVVGVVAHRSAVHTQGWTLYAPLPRRYADYLPGHTPWFPGIVEYAALGLGAGLIAAIALTVLRFRLVRTRPGG